MHQQEPCFAARASKSESVSRDSSRDVKGIPREERVVLNEFRGPICGLPVPVWAGPPAWLLAELGRGLLLRRRHARLRRSVREHLEGLLAPQFLARNRHRVFPDEAAETDVLATMFQRLDQPFHGKVAERIRRDEVRDFGHGLLIRDELVPRLHVDPEVAREPNRWAADPDVDL